MNATTLSLDVTVDGVMERQFTVIVQEHAVASVVSIRPIARVGVTTHGKLASFRQLFVAEDMRGRGYGTVLVEKCIDHARKAGCEAINLCVAAENAAVIPFYKRMGFFVCADNGDFWMVKKLAP